MDQIGDEVNEALVLNEDLLMEKEERLENFLTSYIFCNHPIETAGGSWRTNLNSVTQSILQFSHCSIKTSPNMKGYYCKQCCKTPDTVICHECFREDDHKNHSFVLVPFTSPIQCSCGNSDKYVPPMWCGRHRLDKCTVFAKTEQRYGNLIRLLMEMFKDYILEIKDTYSIEPQPVEEDEEDEEEEEEEEEGKKEKEEEKDDHNEEKEEKKKKKKGEQKVIRIGENIDESEQKKPSYFDINNKLYEFDVYYEICNKWKCMDYKQITLILQGLYNNKWNCLGCFSAENAMKLYEINKEYKLQISYFTEKQNTTLKILLKSFDWLTGMMNIGYKFCDQIINELMKVDLAVNPKDISIVDLYVDNYYYFPPQFTVSMRYILTQSLRDDVFLEKIINLLNSNYTKMYSEVLDRLVPVDYTLLPVLDNCYPISRIVRNIFKDVNILFTLISSIPLLVKIQEYPNQSLRFLSIARNKLLKQIINHILLFLNPIYSTVLLNKVGFMDNILNILETFTNMEKLQFGVDYCKFSPIYNISQVPFNIILQSQLSRIIKPLALLLYDPDSPSISIKMLSQIKNRYLDSCADTFEDYLLTTPSNAGSSPVFNILCSLYSAIFYLNINQNNDSEDLFSTYTTVQLFKLLDYPIRSLIIFSYLVAISQYNTKTYFGYLAKEYSESGQYYFNVLLCQIILSRFDSIQSSDFLLELFNINQKVDDKFVFNAEAIKQTFPQEDKKPKEALALINWTQFINYVTSILFTYLRLSYSTPLPYTLHDSVINMIISYSNILNNNEKSTEAEAKIIERLINSLDLQASSNRDLTRAVMKYNSISAGNNESISSIPYNLLSLEITPYQHFVIQNKIKSKSVPIPLMPTLPMYFPIQELLASIPFLTTIYSLFNNFIETAYAFNNFKSVLCYFIYYSSMNNSKLDVFIDGLTKPYKPDTIPMICKINDDKSVELKNVINTTMAELFNSNPEFRKIINQYLKDRKEISSYKKMKVNNFVPDKSKICAYCNYSLVELYCMNCEAQFCSDCAETLHNKPRFMSHFLSPLVICCSCFKRKETVFAVFHCEDCNLDYCSECSTSFHSDPVNQSHVLLPVFAPKKKVNTAEEEKRMESLSLGLLNSRTFKIIQYLGEGTFGKTFLVYCTLKQLKSFNKKYVLKIVDSSDTTNYVDQMNELDIYSILPQTPYYANLIVKFRDSVGGSEFQSYFNEKSWNISTVFALYNYYPHTLSTYLSGYTFPLSLKLSIDILCQIADGLLNLYYNQIVHRDLRLENIMVSEENNIVLSHFVYSARLNDNHLYREKICKGDILFRAPEIIEAIPIGQPSEYKTVNYEKQPSWELGVVAHYLCFKKHPYVNYPVGSMIYDKSNFDSGSYPEEFVSLIEQLVLIDPSKRLSLEKAVERLQELKRNKDYR